MRRTIDSQTYIFESLLRFARGKDGERPSELAKQSRETSLRSSSRPYESLATTYTSYNRSHTRYDEDTNDIDSSQLTDFKLASTDLGGYRDLLLNECLGFLARREKDFFSFQDWALGLEREVRPLLPCLTLLHSFDLLITFLQNRNRIDTTKDRQDNAIYAFTIVTVIFLPLSAVASIFGMNTRDVRDMDLDQWAYWATAVPVTTVVVLLGLLWTGELGTVWRWIQSFDSRQQGYQFVSRGSHSYDEEYRAPLIRR